MRTIRGVTVGFKLQGLIVTVLRWATGYRLVMTNSGEPHEVTVLRYGVVDICFTNIELWLHVLIGSRQSVSHYTHPNQG